MKYEIGYIFSRIFIQKRVVINDNTEIIPIGNTGNHGAIIDIANKLNEIGFNINLNFLNRILENFKKTNNLVLLKYSEVEASSCEDSYFIKEDEALKIINTLSVVSLNPPQLEVVYSKTKEKNCGLNFFIPKYPIIRHATNIPGFLDAIPDLISYSKDNEKIALLINLFKSALEQRSWINKVLFILILFEEASDNEEGRTFAERLRIHSERFKYVGDLNVVANELNIEIPEGKTVIDMIVKLRNVATHNGTINEQILRELNGEWIIPIFQNSKLFTKLLINSARYLIMTLIGHSRDKIAIKITGPIEIKFD